MKTKSWIAVAFGLLAAGVSGAVLHAQTPARSVLDGVYTEAQANRGKALYTASCAACHGAGLQGSDAAPPLAGGAFLGNWKGQTVADLATRIQTTMPYDNPGSLAVDSVTDVAAYLLSINEFPKGAAELPQDAAGIRIEPKAGAQ